MRGSRRRQRRRRRRQRRKRGRGRAGAAVVEEAEVEVGKVGGQEVRMEATREAERDREEGEEEPPSLSGECVWLSEQVCEYTHNTGGAVHGNGKIPC